MIWDGESCKLESNDGIKKIWFMVIFLIICVGFGFFFYMWV